MDYTKPADVVASMIDAGLNKLALGPRDLLIRGAVSGALLGAGARLAFSGAVTTGRPLVGALIFPVSLALYVTYRPAKQATSASPVVAQAAAE
jgi:formate transporter